MKLAECHPDREHKGRGFCKSCYDKWFYQNSPARQTKARERSRRIYNENKEAAKQYQRDYRVRPDVVERRRERHYQAQYGITFQQYLDRLESQGGVCEICQEVSEDLLHQDHNHATGQLRGLLCASCNLLLGRINEDVNVLQRAIEYLERHRDKEASTV